MERTPESDRNLRAKIEETELRVPKYIMTPDSDLTDDLCYMKVFEDDDDKVMHLAEAVALGAESDRKLYRMRNKEVAKLLGEDDEGAKHIHSLSKATIFILADSETNRHCHSFLDLLGTVEQVRTAEELILDRILKTYEKHVYPVILMPPTVYLHQMNIPLHKVIRLAGIYGNHVLHTEMETGTWIKVDPIQRGDTGTGWEKVLKIYGPRPNVIKAMSTIQAIISEEGESSEAQNPLEQDFQEESFGENEKQQKQVEESEDSERTESDEEEQKQAEDTESTASEDAKKKPVEQGVMKKDWRSELQKYLRAKIEEPYLRLPKAFLKPGRDSNGDPFYPEVCTDPNNDLFYMKIFEDDTHKAVHLKEAVAAGAEADRKVYRMRNKEVAKLVGKDYEGAKYIHRVSKAMIGILADSETNLHRHSFLDLLGTVEQVKTAEELILERILKSYDRLVYPVILMPPTVYHHRMTIPFHKVIRLVGVHGNHLVHKEMATGTWIKIDPIHRGANDDGWERTVKIYGPKENVIRAMLVIQALISEPGESSKAQNPLEQDFEESEH